MHCIPAVKGRYLFSRFRLKRTIQGGNIMAKMKAKTKKAAAKRFKITGTGKLKRMKAYKSHILTKKSPKRKRNLRKATMTDATNVKTMKKIMPYL
jgi:large subunit ribosomal protein L35